MITKTCQQHLLSLVVCSLVGACAHTTPLTTTGMVPSAEGDVKTKVTDAGNTNIDLKVKHLATPDKINPGAKTYVVWTRATQQSQAQNVGALKLDKNLKGELKTVTPLKDFELFVTAEPAGDTSTPSGNILLSTRVAQK